MKVLIFIFILFSLFLNAKDTLLVKQRNALYVQNLIQVEEEIAKQYEKYLLTEFKIPTLSDLINNKYLGSNFSINNILGGNIAFKSTNALTIKFAVTRDLEKYVFNLYKRDLYRDRTSVVIIESSPSIIDTTNSYILFKLKSEEAKNIHTILLSGAVINKDCEGVVVSRYCNRNETSIRWYNNVSNWIEYDKKEFNSGNITIKNVSLLTDSKLNDLVVGSYIYEENGDRHLKLINNEIKEVD